MLDGFSLITLVLVQVSECDFFVLSVEVLRSTDMFIFFVLVIYEAEDFDDLPNLMWRHYVIEPLQ